MEHSVALNDIILSSAALSLWTGEGMARILALQNARVNINCGTSIRDGTGSVSCNSAFVLHLCHFLNQEEFMERKAMVQNP
jgi:hypothetical protein